MTTDETIDPSGVAKGWGTGSAGGSASTPALSAALGPEDGVQPLKVGVEQGGIGNAATEVLSRSSIGEAGQGGREGGNERGGEGARGSQAGKQQGRWQGDSEGGCGGVQERVI